MTDATFDPEIEKLISDDEKEERKRRLLLLLLLLLLVCNCCVAFLFVRYILKPQPLPQLLLPTQAASVCYPPAYKFSISGVDGPVAVAASPDGQRIYAAESKGERLVKMFDRDGNLILSFAPPGTDKANREPKYMAIDPSGRVFLVDRTSNAIDIFDADGNFIDAIIGQHTTLSKFLSKEVGALPDGFTFIHYEGINKVLRYQVPGKDIQAIKVTFPDDEPQWSPLGIRFDAQGNLIYTDITGGLHSVHVIPAAELNAPLVNFDPSINAFGVEGQENGQLSFPQVAVQGNDGNFYVSDGNNARISVWAGDMQYKTFFGFGSKAGSTNLPRGLWLANRNCLHLADAVAGLVRVYDISGAEPTFAFEFGGFGIAEGQFNYPIDVFVDETGRVFVADRENNRIQVWSY